MKHALILQHEPFEGPAYVLDWLTNNDWSYHICHVYRGDAFLPLEEFDLLVMMGGAMSVNDEKELPWLIPEKQFIRKAIAAEKSVLGICLGSQLIASALGAKVYRNEHKEIGWLPVHASPNNSNEAFAFPPSSLVFHWHGETFDLPANSTLLAHSEDCKHQAFQIGKRCIGLQFHPEMSPTGMEDILSSCDKELEARTPYVQSAEQLRAAPIENYKTANRLMSEILDYIT